MKCNSQTLRLRRERVLRLATQKLGSDEAARAWMKATNADAKLDTTEGFTQVLESLEEPA